ncbi:MAG: hypothetical protein U0798_10930 [Gemmataceae bacterium]
MIRPPSDGRAHSPQLVSLSHERLAGIFRRETYLVSGDPSLARVLICEHPFSVTVGRHGSVSEVRHFPHEAVHYVGRGGQAFPHGPGQVALYPIFPLDAWSMTASDHVARLLRIAQTIARQYDVPTTISGDEARVYAGSRCLAAVGVAVHRGVSSYGLILNVNPDLELLSIVRMNERPMTSLVRESPIRVPDAAVPVAMIHAITRLYPDFSPRASSGSFDSTC